MMKIILTIISCQDDDDDEAPPPWFPLTIGDEFFSRCSATRISFTMELWNYVSFDETP